MKNLALFDFDHTLTTNDNFTNFIYYGVPSTRLAIGKVVLAPMLIAYKLRILPGTVLRQLKDLAKLGAISILPEAPYGRSE